MMTGKELLFDTLRNKPTPRVAWVPFVGVHGGKLIDVPADAYLKSPELMVKGLKKAVELYRPDGIPVCFDLQLEAEVLGCQLHWAKAVPPSVITHPLAEGKTLADLPPFEESKGRLPVVLSALRTLKQEIGNEVALYGLVCGPFTLALHLLGSEIFLQMLDDPDCVKRVMAYCTEVGKKMSEAYLKNGTDVIALVDPMTSQISPDHFTEFVVPSINAICDFIREKKRFSALFVCGDVTRNLDAMVSTTADALHVDEQINMEHLSKIASEKNKAFGGNIKLTLTLLLGNENDAQRETITLFDTCGKRGFILSPGCDLPYDVPPKNLMAVAEMVHDDYARELARISLKTLVNTLDLTQVTLPQYTAEKKVIIDVITLDSTACAPCQYMMEAVTMAAASIDATLFDIREHTIKEPAGIAMMVKLGVKALPTICVDGDVCFISIIPDQTTLIERLRQALKMKTHPTSLIARLRAAIANKEDPTALIDQIETLLTQYTS
jgi:MtaA/CmuA family methyltransferase